MILKTTHIHCSLYVTGEFRYPLATQAAASLKCIVMVSMSALTATPEVVPKHRKQPSLFLLTIDVLVSEVNFDVGTK